MRAWPTVLTGVGGNNSHWETWQLIVVTAALRPSSAPSLPKDAHAKAEDEVQAAQEERLTKLLQAAGQPQIQPQDKIDQITRLRSKCAEAGIEAGVEAPSPPQPLLLEVPLEYGNAKLDALVATFLRFNAQYKGEHRPAFYDWEKRRSFGLSRWKGTKPQRAPPPAIVTAGQELEPSITEPEPDPLPECVAEPAIVGRFAPSRSLAQRLIFVLILDGTLNDRASSSGGRQRAPSWHGFDRGYRGRRDALARCIAASLWSDPYRCTRRQPAEGGVTDSCHESSVHPDSVCYAIHEQSGEIIAVSACGRNHRSHWL